MRRSAGAFTQSCGTTMGALIHPTGQRSKVRSSGQCTGIDYTLPLGEKRLLLFDTCSFIVFFRAPPSYQASTTRRLSESSNLENIETVGSIAYLRAEPAKPIA